MKTNKTLNTMLVALGLFGPAVATTGLCTDARKSDGTLDCDC